jgi:phosphate transport system permease protein
MTSPSSSSPPRPRHSQGAWALLQTAIDRAEPLFEWTIRLCGYSAIVFVAAIFFFVFWEAAPALREINLFKFFTSIDWDPSSTVEEQYGILALIVGSVSVTGLAMLIAVPLGLGAAVFLSEFCGGKVKETLKIIIELLAAVPSIVWGFIAYMAISPALISLTGAPVGVNLLNGGIILALMSVPVIVSLSEDALRAVPDSYREAALSLGASHWEIVYRVLFPAAKNGLLAAVLLGVGRAIGETMAVLMATGHAVAIPHSLMDPVRTLTATVASEMGEAEAGSTHFQVLFLIGVVLFAISFVINLTADLVVKGIRNEASR